jgi:hypothetical protein
MPVLSNLNTLTAANLAFDQNYANITVVSGQLPPGLLWSNNALAGTPVISNVFSFINEYRFDFTIGANLVSDGSAITEDYTVCVTKGIPLTRINVTERIRLLGDHYEIALYNNTGHPGTWRLAAGILPPMAELDGQGLIKIQADQNLTPFARDRFTNNAIYNDIDNQQDWDRWFAEFIKETHSYDYSWTLELVDNNNLVLAAHSMRIAHFTVPTQADWFKKYANQISYSSTDLYFLVFDSQPESLTWVTESNLGTIDNGLTCTVSVAAEAADQSSVNYILKPFVYNRLPQGLAFNYDGDLIGRTSFRCHDDDPANVPINNRYEFVCRAYTNSHRSYSEKPFTLTVNKKYNRPLDNIWLYAMTDIANRIKFNNIVNDSRLFPFSAIYRPRDPRFGVTQQIKMLFAAGIEARHISYFENILVKSHYQKSLTMAQPRLAYALNQSLAIEYELVYLPVIDKTTGRSSLESTALTSPIEIDLRDRIVNYYVKDGRSYYTLMPNSLENMRAVLRDAVGSNDIDHMPLWMTSIQPGSAPGRFTLPIGFISAVPLAYCRPGFGRVIMQRVKNINFNTIDFSFDRYQLENQLSQFYDFAANSYTLGSNIARFDGGTTIFDSNSTKVLENIEYYYSPESGNKYLKFPKTNIFK